jgi:hypothetical protein
MRDKGGHGEKIKNKNWGGGSLMIKVMNDGLPRLAELIAIFSIEVIGMFFDF